MSEHILLQDTLLAYMQASLVNQTIFCERACASEKGEGKEKYGLAKLARFLRPRQDHVVTNQIADPASLTLGAFRENLKACIS